MYLVVRFLIFALILASAGLAYAQFNGCGPGFCNVTATGAAPPGTCSNTLDFSDSCNSQYITVI